MPIKTNCEHCGFAYSAPDAMAGKHVRCRNCGQIFTIPGETVRPVEEVEDQFFHLPPVEPTPPLERQLEETRVMPPISTSESNMTGGVGSAKSYMERSGDPGMFDVSGEAYGGVRPSTPFRFPYASDLDSWLPRIVPVLMIGWVLYVLWSWRPVLEEGASYPAWGGVFPVSLAVILLAILWWPIFSAAVHKVAHNLNFALPSGSGLRSLCVASLPFAFGGLFWIAGGGIVTMVIGMLIGVALAVPTAWFLFRLRTTELIHVGVALTLAGAVSAAISGLAFFGANVAVSRTLGSMNKGSLFPASPLGPELSWEIPEPAPVPLRRIATSRPARTSTAQMRTVQPESPTTGNRVTEAPGAGNQSPTPLPRQPVQPGQAVPPAWQPGGPGVPPIAMPMPMPEAPPTEPEKISLAENPYLSEAKVLQVGKNLQQVIYPLVGDCRVLAVAGPSRAGSDSEITVYRISPFEPMPGGAAVFSSGISNYGYALSPSGERVARVSKFGEAVVDVFSFKESNSIATETPPKKDFGPDIPPRLVGFVDENTVLCEWLDSELELWTFNFNTPKEFWSRYLVGSGRFSPLVGVLPGEKPYPWLAVFGPAPRTGVPGLPSLQFWTRNPKVGQLNPVSKGLIPLRALRNLNILPTGLATWQDPEAKTNEREKVAVSFQEGGQLRFWVFNRLDGTGAPEADVTIPGGISPINPSASMTTNHLLHLRGKLLLYNNAIIDYEQRKVVHTLDLQVVDARKVNATTLHLIVQGASGLRIVQATINP